MQKFYNKNNKIEIVFEEIYSAYLHKLQFFAYSYLQDLEASKCVAHEVFISLWEKRESIDFERDILTYLLVLTKNRCLNIIRKRKVEKQYQNFSQNFYDKELLNYKALQDTSATALYAKEIEKLLTESLDCMPEKIKSAFYFNRFSNLKYEEIAKLQGVSVKTIEYRMMVALRILRLKFKDYLPLILGYLLIVLCLY